jgi:hypothetical protein
MSDEWSDWILHDGKGCPCVGMMVQVTAIANRLGDEKTHPAKIAKGGPSWLWAETGLPPNVWQWIIRYRIRKPRGLTILENLIADLPAPVQPRVPA